MHIELEKHALRNSPEITDLSGVLDIKIKTRLESAYRCWVSLINKCTTEVLKMRVEGPPVQYLTKQIRFQFGATYPKEHQLEATCSLFYTCTGHVITLGVEYLQTASANDLKFANYNRSFQFGISNLISNQNGQNFIR